MYDIDHEITPNGDLVLRADDDMRETLRDSLTHRDYYSVENSMADAMRNTFEFIAPETIGALTDAPILCRSDDCIFNKDTCTIIPTDDAVVWWFPDYMIRCPWETLAETGSVTFTKAGN